MSSAIGSSVASQRLFTEAAEPTGRPTATEPSLDAGVSRAALYQTFGDGAFATGPSGIRLPLNAEDSAIVLAQAALAIDEASKTASNNRIANATDGSRSGIGSAISTLIEANGLLVTTLAQKKAAETEVRGKQADRTVKTGEAAALQTQIANLQARLADASEDDAPAIRQQVAAAQTALTAKNGEIASLDRQIATLGATIDALALKIPGYQAAAQLGSTALLRAYSQVALQLQDAGGARTQDAAKSTDLDRGLDDLSDILKTFQQSSLARMDDDRKADRMTEETVSRRVVEAAVGLVTGLSEILDLLKQPDPAAAVNSREEAIVSGRRFQLPV